MEFDGKSAGRAKENLSDRSNVDVVHANGWDAADVVYVNYAVPSPAASWIENLKRDGRLIFPLGVQRNAGQVLNSVAFLITRRHDGYEASAVGAVSFIYAEGLPPEPDEKEFKALQRSLKKGGWEGVKSLIWNRPIDDTECWYEGPGWALSFNRIAR